MRWAIVASAILCGCGGEDGTDPRTDAGRAVDSGVDASEPASDSGASDAGSDAGVDAASPAAASPRLLWTAGAGVTSSARHRLQAAVGAPQPMGVAESGRHRVVLPVPGAR